MPWAWANTRASSTGFDRGAGLTGPPPDQDFVYVNDFPNSGRLSQVIVQADAPARMHVEDVLRLELRSAERSMVPLSQVVTPVWEAAACNLTATTAIRRPASRARRPTGCRAARR